MTAANENTSDMIKYLEAHPDSDIYKIFGLLIPYFKFKDYLVPIKISDKGQSYKTLIEQIQNSSEAFKNILREADKKVQEQVPSLHMPTLTARYYLGYSAALNDVLEILEGNKPKREWDENDIWKEIKQ